MHNEQEKREEETKVLEVDKFNWQIPECCREGWESCPHVVKPVKQSKRNIGL